MSKRPPKRSQSSTVKWFLPSGWFGPRSRASSGKMNAVGRAPRVIFAFALCLFVALAGRLLYIHFTSHAELKKMADKQQQMLLRIVPQRGSILDRKLRVLVSSMDVESVFADPKLVEDNAKASRAIAPILGLPVSELCRRLDEAGEKRFVWIKRRLSLAEAKAVRRARVGGIGLVTEGQRNYPNGPLAAHVIGTVGVECQGLEGIEFLFNESLSGSHDLRRVKADARRRPLWVECTRDEGEVGSSIADLNRDGRTIVLTIDKAIQSFVEIELKRVIEKYEAKGVIGIVMDPRTGEVLAMANLPVYDPNNYGDYPAEARRNRAITDPYEPGSTFKAFVAAAALAKGVVKMEEQIHCGNGVWRYRSRTINDHHSYGRLSFQDIVVKSSNVGMAKLGVRLGDERLRQAVLDFGFGSKTGILLSGENAGVVQSAQKWSYWTTTSVPFGHEIMVTPLQLVTAFSVFANGGKLLKPRIVRGILDTRGRLVADLAGKPEVVSQVMPEPLANAFRDEVLVEVVERGTGRQCKISGYKVFGKTGTAQKLAPPGSAESGNGYSHELYVGSFVAGAPAEAPRLVVLVAVDEPNKSKGYYGGTVAAPAVRAILEQTLAYLGVRPEGAVAGSRRSSWDPRVRLTSDGSTR